MKHATLEVLSGEYQGLAFPLKYHRVTLGSAPDCHVTLPSYDRVSAHHAEIIWDGTAFHVEDKSGQGIGANGVLMPAAQLTSGAVVQMGDFRARLQTPTVPEFEDSISVSLGASTLSAPVTRSLPNPISNSGRQTARQEQRWAVIGGLAFGAAAVTVFLLLAQFSASPLLGGARQPAPNEQDTDVTPFSVIERSNENAQRASCQSNLKQVALAVFQYQQDYDEKFPLVAPEADPTYYGWTDFLQPYLKSTAIFQCPSQSNVGGNDPRESGYTDYFFNVQLNAEKQSDLQNIASLVLMGDGGSSRGRYNSNGCNSNDDWPVSNCETSRTALIPDGGATRHLDGGNYAFADGHVKWLRGEADGASLSIGNSLDLSREYSFGFNYVETQHSGE